jgi:hypothetical protein
VTYPDTLARELVIRLARMSAPPPGELLRDVAEDQRPAALATVEPDSRAWDALRRLLGRSPTNAERHVFASAYREQLLAYERRRLADYDRTIVRDVGSGFRAAYPSSTPCIPADDTERLEADAPPEDQWLTIGDALAVGHERVYLWADGWYPDEERPPWRLSVLERDEEEEGRP